MRIKSVSINLYEIPLTTGSIRTGALIGITDEKGMTGWGEIGPLPPWSRETLEDCFHQLHLKKESLLSINWERSSCFETLKQLNLLPSVTFGLESALLSLLDPLPNHSVSTSALLMGTPQQILEQAECRKKEGYTSAKLKVSTLTLDAARSVIDQLKHAFRLRIDVNRAWTTQESLHFFSHFPLDTFDYVEEPFQNPHDLDHFLHPLAVDESFPADLSLPQLEALPTLKALIYKPSIQGGITKCLGLHKWTQKKGIELVLSSSFESDIGLAHIAAMAYRLNLPSPIGLGTFHFLGDSIGKPALSFSQSLLSITSPIIPKSSIIRSQNTFMRKD